MWIVFNSHAYVNWFLWFSHKSIEMQRKEWKNVKFKALVQLTSSFAYLYQFFWPFFFCNVEFITKQIRFTYLFCEICFKIRTCLLNKTWKTFYGVSCHGWNKKSNATTLMEKEFSRSRNFNENIHNNNILFPSFVNTFRQFFCFHFFSLN